MGAFLIAVVGAAAGSAITALAPRLFGAARTGIPRLLGFIKLTYLRTAAGGVFGLCAATAITLSTSDHSHKTVTYVLWYGVAALALVVVIWLTVVIDRRSERKQPAGAEKDRVPQPTASALRSPLLRPPQGGEALQEARQTALADARRKAADKALAGMEQQDRERERIKRAVVDELTAGEPKGISPELRKWLDHERERGTEYAAQIRREGEHLLKEPSFMSSLKALTGGMTSMSLSGFTARAREWSRAIADRLEGIETVSAHIQAFREAPPPADPDPTEGDFRRLADYVELRVRVLSEMLR